MYVNTGHADNYQEVLASKSHGLLITSCGNYQIKKKEAIITRRPKGRKDYQIVYIHSGRGHFVIDGKDTVVEEGSVVIMRPDEPQDYTYFREDKTSAYWVHFTGYDVQTVLKAYGIQDTDKVIHIGKTTDHHRIFEQMITELQLKKDLYNSLLKMLLSSILIQIGRSVASPTSDAIQKEVEDALVYFRKNYKKEINVNEYAASIGYSPSWLIRCFKNVTGQSPLQYIISLRISNAQSLLENPNATITEVAQSLGYDNPLYFSRIFQKHTGLSPTEYRKQFLAEK